MRFILSFWCKQKTEDKLFVSECYPRFRRKEATRTPDPYVPNVVRYQLRYFPILRCKVKK